MRAEANTIKHNPVETSASDDLEKQYERLIEDYSEPGLPPQTLRTDIRRVLLAVEALGGEGGGTLDGAGEAARKSPPAPGPLQTFGLYLSRLRRARRISLEELSGRTGLNADELYLAETGVLGLDELSAYLPAVCRELNVRDKEVSGTLVRLITEQV